MSISHIARSPTSLLVLVGILPFHLNGEGIHALGVLFSSPTNTWDITIHLHSGPSVLASTLPSSNRRGTTLKSTSLGPAFLLAHRLVSTYLWGTVRRLTHRRVSDSDTICNNPGPEPFRASLQDFKTRFLGEGFNTLINGGLFSSPTNVEHYSRTD